MLKIALHKIGGGDLRCMTPTERQEFYRRVDAEAQRLFESVHKRIARRGPWIYARFWRLASELPIIKNRLDWRDDTIQEYQELADKQFQALVKRKNPERNKERNAEIMRLHWQGLPPGRIWSKIKTRWPRLENGRPITVNAIKSVIRHRTKGRRKRSDTL